MSPKEAAHVLLSDHSSISSSYCDCLKIICFINYLFIPKQYSLSLYEWNESYCFFSQHVVFIHIYSFSSSISLLYSGCSHGKLFRNLKKSVGEHLGCCRFRLLQCCCDCSWWILVHAYRHIYIRMEISIIYIVLYNY